MEEEDVYTKDGTVDYRGKPANKKKTGTWKACPFILGTYIVVHLLNLYIYLCKEKISYRFFALIKLINRK